ncbi:hypothetical protein lbkm_4161 [Lachnospiraceae bacterium KM106-2]|nr:hypothetical protein lbkm_4161 [Lachnospiraceae bacterium KM106-2]
MCNCYDVIINEENKEKCRSIARNLVKKNFTEFPDQWMEVEQLEISYKDQLFPKYQIVYYSDEGNEVAFFVFSCENIEKGNQLELFYLHMWQSAYMNAIRKMLVDMIKEQISDLPSFHSGIMGPGYGEVGMEELDTYCKRAKAENIGVVVENRHLSPAQSCVGAIYFASQPFTKTVSPCTTCKSAGKNCSLFCIFGDK